MAKRENQKMQVVPTDGTLTSPLVIPVDDVEEAVVLEEMPADHPNFIESNTSAISLEDPQRNVSFPPLRTTHLPWLTRALSRV